MRRTLAVGAGLMGLAFVLSWIVWGRMPDPMPVHWDASGHADGYAPRAWALLLFPVLGSVVTLVVGVLTGRNPATRSAATILVAALAAFHVGMHALTIRAGLDPSAELSIGLCMALLGGLFAALGAVMPRLKPNPYAGVRVPWTMSDETNWTLTHRLAGKTMIAGGAAAALAGLLLDPPWLFPIAIAAVLIGALIPIPYSYALYRARRR